ATTLPAPTPRPNSTPGASERFHPHTTEQYPERKRAVPPPHHARTVPRTPASGSTAHHGTTTAQYPERKRAGPSGNNISLVSNETPLDRRRQLRRPNQRPDRPRRCYPANKPEEPARIRLQMHIRRGVAMATRQQVPFIAIERPRVAVA